MAKRQRCIERITKLESGLHMFKLTGLQTKLSKQNAITTFLAQVEASIVRSETISNLPKMVLNERISTPNN
jgi:hypothetical protein